jgi:CRISPR/Cas system-associated exonuclease Cas4 (RecB family)
VPSIAALSLAPWSLSKIQCALRCPLEFHLRYVDRLHEADVSPEARLGKAIHGALEAVLGGAAVPPAIEAARRELPDEERARFEAVASSIARFVERIEKLRARRRVRSELIEHRLAVSFDFAPTDFVARDAFFRGVWDAGYLFDDGVLAVVDHKTGVRRPGADYGAQLEGYAALAVAHMVFVRRIWLGVHFVGDAALEWTPPLEPDAVRRELVPRLLAQIEQAARAVARRDPRPSTWCARCSFRAICPSMRARALAELPETEPELVTDVPKD